MLTTDISFQRGPRLPQPLIAVLILAFVQWQSGTIVGLTQVLGLLEFAETAREGYGPSHALVAVLQAASLGGVGTLLLVGQRNDLRASYLGSVFLLSAATFGLIPIMAIVGQDTAFRVAPMELLTLVPADAFLAYCLWRFAALFPSAVDAPVMRRTLRWGVVVAGVGGCLLMVSNAVGWVADAGWYRFVNHRSPQSLQQWFSLGMGMLAITSIAFRFRQAAQRDRFRARRLRTPLALIGTVLALSLLTMTMLPNLSPVVREELSAAFSLFSLAFLLPIPPLIAFAVTSERTLNVRLRAPRLMWSLMARVVPAILLVSAIVLFLTTLLGAGAIDEVTGETGVLTSVSREFQLLLWFTVGLVASGLLFARQRPISAAPPPSEGALGELRAIDAPHQWHQWLTSLSEAFEVTSVEVVVVDDRVPEDLVPTREGARDLRSLFALRNEAIDLESAGFVGGVDSLPSSLRSGLAHKNTAVLQPVFDTAGEPLAVLIVGGRRDQRALDLETLSGISVVASAIGLFLERKRLEDNSSSSRSPSRDLPAVQCSGCDRVYSAVVERCPDCDLSTQPIDDPLIIGGKFQLDRVVGVGALGKVYSAHDVVLDRKVAIKAVPTGTPAGVRVLTQEARAVAALDNPGLARVYVAESHGRRLFIVSELLEGGTLLERISEESKSGNGAALEERVITLGLHLLEALLPLHERDLVHGDLKPSNIGFDATGSLKLLDFGMVHMLDEAAAPGTPDSSALRSSTVLPGGHAGTPLYSPPEAWRGEPVGTAADLWPVGVILWEVLAGVHPFERQENGEVTRVVATRRAILEAELQPPPQMIEASPQLVRVLVRALDLEPGRRFVDVHTFKAALLQCRESLRTD